MFRAISQNLFEPSTTAESILGSEHRLGACASDRGLFYVDSAGAYAGSYGSSYKPAATDVLVVQYANSGPLVLRYVLFDGAKERGEPVKWSNTVDGEVQDCTAGSECAGVTLCDVANNDYGWIACEGTVQALADSAGIAAAGTLLKCGSAGFDETAAGAAEVAGVAKSLAVIAASTLGKVKLLS